MIEALSKGLSAVALLLLSLVFGLLIPYLIRKPRARNLASSCQNQPEETEGLLSNQKNLSNCDSTPDQETNQVAIPSVKKIHTNRFCGSIFKYDLISFLNCICGGLFLGICLLELLPEARESVQTILTDLNVQTSFPVTEFFVAIGLLLIMLIEQAVNSIYMRQQASRNSGYEVIGETTTANYSPSSSTDQNVADNQSQLCEDIESYSAHCKDGGSTSTTAVTRSIVLIALLSVHSVFEGLALGLSETLSYLIELLIAIAVHKSVIAFSLGIKLFETFAPNKVFIAVICALIFCSASPLGCAVGIFVTLGSDNTGWNPSDVTTIVPNTTSQFTTVATKLVTGTDYASAIMECLATGTFLYVTFIEVFPLEFAHGNDNHMIDDTNHQTPSRPPRKQPIGSFVKLVALLVGFGVITGLQFI